MLVTGEEDLDYVKQTESSRMSWCLADVVEANGDVGMSGGYGLWGPAVGQTIYPDMQPTVDDINRRPNPETPVFPAGTFPGGNVPLDNIPQVGIPQGHFPARAAYPYGHPIPQGVVTSPSDSVLYEREMLPSDGSVPSGSMPNGPMQNGLMPNGAAPVPPQAYPPANPGVPVNPQETPLNLLPQDELDLSSGLMTPPANSSTASATATPFDLSRLPAAASQPAQTVSFSEMLGDPTSKVSAATAPRPYAAAPAYAGQPTGTQPTGTPTRWHPTRWHPTHWQANSTWIERLDVEVRLILRKSIG